MKLLQKALLLALLLLPAFGYSQDISSGFLHVANGTEQLNVLKLDVPALDARGMDAINSDFPLYSPSIAAWNFDAQQHKLFVKFTNAIDANMILGILERRAINAFYLDGSGNTVVYNKTGHESFRR